MNKQQNPYILIIEDDFAIRESLIEMLTDEGYHVCSSENGLEALNFLNSAEILPSFIILDLMMPIMDGYEFRREQLKQEKFSSIPTALVSADRNLCQKAQSLGMELFLKKPLDLSSLFKLTESYARTSSGESGCAGS